MQKLRCNNTLIEYPLSAHPDELKTQ